MEEMPDGLQGMVTADDIREAAAGYLTPWMRYFLRLDPEPILREVAVPVLALFGENDLQVPAEANAAAVEEALAAGAAPSFQVEIFPGVNHLFQHSETGRIGEYSSIDETMAPEVLQLVTDWIRRTSGGEATSTASAEQSPEGVSAPGSP
jgi:dienelactone hydrolase